MIDPIYALHLTAAGALGFGAGAAWGYVRGEFKVAGDRVAAAQKCADRAHVRIDNLLEGGRK